MLKSKFILKVLVLVLIVTSCNKENDEVTVEPTQLIELKSVEDLKNQELITKLENKLSNKITSRSNRFSESLNIDNATISEYEGYDIKSINISMSDNLTYTTYSKENELVDVEILTEIIQNGNSYSVKYYNLNYEEIGGVTVDNGIVTNAYGFFNDENLSGRSSQMRGWWDTWGDCIGYNLDTMTDGSVEGSIFGLACIAFGPECAAGLAIGCAVAASIL